ncbi:MAG: 3-methyl-2-oxobutanoate dehydrogenase subunit VorB [Bacillota bacterium]
MSKILMKGNEALGEAAIKAGCRYFFGYPITPQNEIPQYLSKRMPEVGGVYLQAESEVAAINMVYGAAGSGARVMTSSSSPGVSLKMEGLSYIAGAELPCVIVNMMRGGPGLGSIQPAQGDYFQATKGGGHGDYRTLVLAPASIQEAVDLIIEAFDLADKYRNPVMILGDGVLGQMMEPVEFKKTDDITLPHKDWAATGKKNRKKNVINSLYLQAEKLEQHVLCLAEKFGEMEAKEQRAETYLADDAEILLAAYGTTSRVCKAAIDMAREEGIKAGLFRPISLWPYPVIALQDILPGVKGILTVEMSLGQMVEDVRLAVNGKVPVDFYGRTGGMVPTARAVYEKIMAFQEVL